MEPRPCVQYATRLGCVRRAAFSHILNFIDETVYTDTPVPLAKLVDNSDASTYRSFRYIAIVFRAFLWPLCVADADIIMVALCNRADHYILCPVISIFFLSSFFPSFFFPSPNLSGRRLDVYHTSTHGVALVRIYDAGLKPAARGSLEMQDAKKSPKIAIWAPSHNFVGLYLRN